MWRTYVEHSLWIAAVPSPCEPNMMYVIPIVPTRCALSFVHYREMFSVSCQSVQSIQNVTYEKCVFLARARVGAQSGLGPGPGWGPYGPIGPLWAHRGPHGPIRALMGS